MPASSFLDGCLLSPLPPDGDFFDSLRLPLVLVMVQVKFCFLWAVASATMPAFAYVLCCTLEDLCDLLDLVETGCMATEFETMGVTDWMLIFISALSLPLAWSWPIIAALLFCELSWLACFDLDPTRWYYFKPCMIEPWAEPFSFLTVVTLCWARMFSQFYFEFLVEFIVRPWMPVLLSALFSWCLSYGS